MAKILFRVLPESGHMNASFELAKAFKEKGHCVTYASVSVFENTIKEQGFNFHLLDEELIWAGSARFIIEKNRNPIKWLSLLLRRRQFFASKLEKLLKGDAFLEEIAEIQPDLVLVDSPFERFATSIPKTDTPFMIMESMVALDFSRSYPPLCSYHVPTNTLLSRFRSNAEWFLYFARKRFIQTLGLPTVASKSTFRKLCKVTGFDFAAIDFNRYFHTGFQSVPELILSPPELDFPRTPKANQLYVRTVANKSRPESSYDYSFDRIFSNVVSKKELKTSHKLVYCSLGGMSFRYLGIADFYRRLIQACSGLENITLLISMGNELSLESFEPCPANIHIFRRVPQLRVLEAIDLMVTHGGMNSIKECVSAGVPMLAYPGDNKIDQAGNAARVVYHGMGLMGKLLKEPSTTMAEKITTILNDKRFAANTRQKRNEILKNTTPEKANASIDAILELAAKASKNPERFRETDRDSSTKVVGFQQLVESATPTK